MRNLAKYPLNANEVTKDLSRAKDDAIKDLAPGDTLAASINKAVDFINSNQEAFDAFCAKEFELVH